MDSLRKQIDQLTNQINARNIRERVLIFIASVLVLSWFLNVALLDPIFAKERQLVAQINTDQGELNNLEAELNILRHGGVLNPNQKELNRIKELTEKLKDLHHQVQSSQASVVIAERVPDMLQDILSQHQSLTLVSIRTLPTDDLTSKTKQKQQQGRTNDEKQYDETVKNMLKSDINDDLAAAEIDPNKKMAEMQKKYEEKKKLVTNVPKLFKHGIEIKIRGSYGQLVDYVHALEKLDWRMGWAELTLESKNYPESELTIIVYTLSLESEWIKIA